MSISPLLSMLATCKNQSLTMEKQSHSTYGYLLIQDTAGQEVYHALSTLYYRDAQFAIIVYDLTDVDSFAKLKSWVDQLKSEVPSCEIVLAANKCDMKWKVSEADTNEYCIK